jgi:hypothetical protein
MSDEIRPPSEEKWQWLEQAEQYVLQLLRRRYGNVVLDHSQADLRLAQRLIDDDAVGPDQVLELQCLGVILGNVFASQTSMQWSFVTNEFGAMLALHSPEIGFTLYPLTMISKRVEDRREVDMPALYLSFVADLGLSEK